jgi:hypothetical protein
MLSPSLSIALGFAFVLLGAINVWLVLESWSRVKAARVSARTLTLHRIGGYLFIGLFCRNDVLHVGPPGQWRRQFGFDHASHGTGDDFVGSGANRFPGRRVHWSLDS